MLGRVVVGLWLAILAATPVAAQDYETGMAAYRLGDYATALHNWRALAQRGDAAAQSSVGFMYNYGHGVSQDYAQALKWYRRAARQNFPAAQYHLGFLYTKGQGVPQDYVRAHMWFELGAAGGLVYSEKNRAILARRMTPDQIAKARDMAREWRAQARERAGGTNAARRKTSAAKPAPPPRPAAPRRQQAAKAAPSLRKAASSVPAREANAHPAPEKAKAAGPANKKQMSAAPPSANLKKAEGAKRAPPSKAVDHARLSANAKKAESAKRASRPEAVDHARRSPPVKKAEKTRAGAGPVLLQLGATKSKEFAVKDIARIAKAHAAVLGDVKIKAVRKDLGPRGVYYRLRAGPIDDAAAGKAMCRKLIDRGQNCLVIQP